MLFLRRLGFSLSGLVFATAISAITVFSVSGSADAATISVIATDDANLKDSNGDFMTDSFTANEPNDVFLRPFGQNEFLFRAALEFSLAGIPSGSTINTVNFLFSDRGTTVTGFNFNIFGYAGDGVINVGDGNNVGNLLTSIPVLPGQPDYDVPLPATFIQGLVDSSMPFAGLVMASSNEGSTDIFGADICSIDFPACDDPGTPQGVVPTLRINFTAVDEPGALALFGLGLAGLGFARRRKAA
jgi:hypothetical protein